MSHTATYTMTVAVADEIIASLPSSGFNGRRCERASATTIELYAANRDHAEFAALVARMSRTIASTSLDATPAQINYLTILIQRDPGSAMTFGASRDGVRPVSGLTKSAASALIDTLRGEA